MILHMLRLGTFGFGGPVALVGYMHRDLVERRGWISEEDYKEGLALAQMMPGPLAAQLGIYLGYVHYRLLGATLVGIAFVLPSFLMVVSLGWAYAQFGGLSWMQAVFYGVGAAVVGIIAMSAYKLTTKTIGKNRLLWTIYLTVAVVTVVTESEIAWLFIAGGLLNWFWRAPPKWLGKGGLNALAVTQVPTVSGVLSGLDWPLLGQIGLFFVDGITAAAVRHHRLSDCHRPAFHRRLADGSARACDGRAALAFQEVAGAGHRLSGGAVWSYCLSAHPFSRPLTARA
jgi:chromate transporter